MQKRWTNVIDLKGNAVVNATVKVITYPNGALAALFSDSGALAPIPNPMTTDTDGYVEYYAANGHYSWVITTNISSKTVNDVIHDDAADANPCMFFIATGTGDAMVVSAFPGIYALDDGDEILVRAPGENTVDNPTISLPGVGVLTIKKRAGQPLEPQQGGVAGTGDITGAGAEITLRYVASSPHMELIGVL